MEWLFFWFLLAIVVGIAANSRGRSGFGWFLLAVVLSPLIAGFLVLALPNASAAANRDIATVAPLAYPTGTKICPDCAEEVLANARICRFCRHEFAEPQETLRNQREYKGIVYVEQEGGSVFATVRGEQITFPSFEAFKRKIDRYRS